MKHAAPPVVAPLLLQRFGRPGAAVFALGLAALGGYRYASAQGAPITGALTYSGVLTDAAGAPLSSPQTVKLELYDAATLGSRVCESPGGSVALNDIGGFSVALPDTCATAVAANPNLWVDVLVGGSSVGRSKIGAVPYALEATRATTANAAGGALATQLAAKAEVANIPKITAWTSYQPTFFHGATPIPAASVNLSGKWRRVGENIEIAVSLFYGTTVSTVGDLSFSSPPGITFDRSRAVDAMRTGIGSIGYTGDVEYLVVPVLFSSTTVKFATNSPSTRSLYLSNSFPVAVAQGTSLRVHYSFPVQGWTVTN
jgi:hypothetical protein